MPYLSLRMIALAGLAMSLVLSCGDAHAGFALPATGSGASSANASSAMGGAHAGYNWQQGAAVFGFATDLQATQLSTAQNAALIYPSGPGPILPTDYAVTWSTVDWFGTVRGQVGLANGPLLLYGTAGVAYGHSYLKSQYSTAGASLVAQASELRAGWTAGAGFKYLVSPNLSFGLQYLYVDLGGLGLAASTPSPAITTLAFNSSTSNQFHTVTAGISWHFTAGSTAALWQGGYAGLHGGGAWGNETNATYAGTTLFPSDARLKRDVALVGRRGDGLGIYAYKYLWSDAVYVGVMAQEVALVHPQAVFRDKFTGYMAVDYGMLNRF